VAPGHTSPDQGPFGEMAAATLDHLNDEHHDTITFLGRALCDDLDVRAATLTSVDHDGIDAVLVTQGGDMVERRLTFVERAETPEQAQLQFYGLLTSARQQAGGTDLTSLERELLGARTIATFVTTVTAIVDINPRLRQITVGGGLDGFAPLAADQFVYVLAPPHGRSDLTVDESFSWEQYDSMPEHDRPVGAYYTVRRWDAEAGTIDLWVVLHGHDGDGERWARNARVGDPVALWGPREAYQPPPGTDSFLLIGDETALPAIAAIVERLRPHDRATAIVALAPEADRVALDSPAELDVRWLQVAHDDRSNPLMAAVLALPNGVVTPSTYVWGGAESHEITAIRRHVRDQVGIPRQQVSLTGYWRRDDGAA
jgi:NADPH-dependent ferric siderophore reductase